MTPPDTSDAFTLTCRISDAYDAAIRLLNDAQRFGAQLVKLEVAAKENTLSLTILLPQGLDPGNLRDRFGRHQAVWPIPAESME